MLVRRTEDAGHVRLSGTHAAAWPRLRLCGARGRGMRAIGRGAGHTELQGEVRLTLWKRRAQQRECDIIDGRVVPQPSLEGAVMRVSVEHRAHGIAQERLLQPAGAKEGIDLDRLALDGGRRHAACATA